MQTSSSCGGATPTYTFVAGEYYFQRVTLGPQLVSAGAYPESGTSGSPIYIRHVDNTWYPAALSRDRFSISRKFPPPRGRQQRRLCLECQSTITLDQHRRLLDSMIAGRPISDLIVYRPCGKWSVTSEFTVQNVYIHGWVATTGAYDAGGSNQRRAHARHRPSLTRWFPVRRCMRSSDGCKSILGRCVINVWEVANSHCSHTGQVNQWFWIGPRHGMGPHHRCRYSDGKLHCPTRLQCTGAPPNGIHTNTIQTNVFTVPVTAPSTTTTSMTMSA